MSYYKRKIKSYNNGALNILKNEIDLILPQIHRKQKCGIITTLVSSFIGLVMKAFLVSYTTNETKHYIKQSKLWIAKWLKKLIDIVHQIHNTTSYHERLFAGQQSLLELRSLYANALGLQHYSINSLLYLRKVQDKYISLYKELISQLCIYATAIRVLAKGYLHVTQGC